MKGIDQICKIKNYLGFKHNINDFKIDKRINFRSENEINEFLTLFKISSNIELELREVLNNDEMYVVKLKES